MNAFTKIKNSITLVLTGLGFYRANNGMVGGVCQGLADRLGWNVWIIRLIWIISPFITLGTSIIIYLLCVLVMPKKQVVTTKNRTNYSNDDYIDVNGREL